MTRAMYARLPPHHARYSCVADTAGTSGRRARHATLAAALALAAAAAQAHDTWFAVVPSAPGAAPLLALGTGNRFPKQEFTLGQEQLQHSGCSGAGDAVLPLSFERDSDTALVMRAALPAGSGQTCWAQSVPFVVELQDDTVALYLKEIQAPAAVHRAWAALHARSLPWQEQYTKHARILLGETPVASAGTADVPMGMDLLLHSGTWPLRAGDEASFQLLRDGQPLAGQALELHSDRSPLGLWRRTDDEGRVSFRLPLAGHWVLRGTDLRLSGDAPETWESRFVTLTFDVQPKATAPAAPRIRTAAPSD